MGKRWSNYISGLAFPEWRKARYFVKISRFWHAAWTAPPDTAAVLTYAARSHDVTGWETRSLVYLVYYYAQVQPLTDNEETLQKIDLRTRQTYTYADSFVFTAHHHRLHREEVQACGRATTWTEFFARQLKWLRRATAIGCRRTVAKRKRNCSRTDAIGAEDKRWQSLKELQCYLESAVVLQLSSQQLPS